MIAGVRIGIKNQSFLLINLNFCKRDNKELWQQLLGCCPLILPPSCWPMLTHTLLILFNVFFTPCIFNNTGCVCSISGDSLLLAVKVWGGNSLHVFTEVNRRRLDGRWNRITTAVTKDMIAKVWNEFDYRIGICCEFLSRAYWASL